MLELQKVFSERIAVMLELVEQTNKASVLVIQQFPISEDYLTKLPKVRESISNILTFVELGNVEILQEVLSMADGVFDNIIFDADIKLPQSKTLLQMAVSQINQSKLFFYSDIHTWADSALQFILQKEKGLCGKQVLLLGKGLLYEACLSRIKLLGANLTTNPKDKVEVVIGAQIKGLSGEDAILERLQKHSGLYDIGIGNFSTHLINHAAANGHAVYRIDIRAGISSLVINILETDHLIHKVMGKTKIRGIELVAGGIMGSENAVIIDNINDPSTIIGVADGKGNVKIEIEEDDHKNVAFIEQLIKQI